MAGREPRPRRSGRWRLLAGLSVVLSAVTLLLSVDARRRRGDEGQEEASGESSAHAVRHGPPPDADTVRNGFESSDADPGSIGIAMAIGVGAIAVAIVGLFLLLGALHRANEAAPPLTAQQRAPIAPPGPPLQASPQYDLASLGKLQTARLTGYGWLSPAHDAARIPIERAMALVAGQSLDAKPAQARP